MVSILNRKLFRDLVALRGPALTVGLLVAAGVAVMTGSLSTYLSLLNARSTYYDKTHFADLFFDLKRAPNHLETDLANLAGVGAVQTRIVQDVRIDWSAAPNEVSGLMISLPEITDADLNALTLKSGRWPDTDARDEVLINVAFADVWSVKLESQITVLLNGHKRNFTIVGTAYSPEYVYAARPGNPLPDDKTYALIWTQRSELESTLNLKGAFNSLAIKLAPGANESEAIDAIEAQVRPYGSLGAVRQRDQTSNRFLSDELIEQKTMSVVVPLVFFAVSAFLLNSIMSRLTNAQREQIATLKALGYPSLPIALHYAEFVALIAITGSLVGSGLGILYGKAVMTSYASFFRFPEFSYVMPIWAPVIATSASLAAALAGAVLAVFRILRLTAAEALRPSIPAEASHQLLAYFLKPRAKIALRNMLGRPIRTLFTIAGLSTAIPMIVLGLFWWDALDSMIRTQFQAIDRSDATITFTSAQHQSVLEEIRKVAPDIDVEGMRVVPVELRSGHREKRVALTGLSKNGALRSVRDLDLRFISIPEDGLILNRQIADELGLSIGDQITIEILDGQHPTMEATLTGKIEEVLGAGAYMDLDALNRLLGDVSVVSHALIRSPQHLTHALAEIGSKPNVLASASKDKWISMFREKIMGLITVSATILTLFGILVAVGVVYNSARVAFQERTWELASLRVLGFSRAEVGNILFTELAIELLISIPFGLFLAHTGISYLLTSRSNESFSIPPVINPDTMALAALIVISTALLSGWAVKRRIDNLNLVAALKTRD